MTAPDIISGGQPGGQEWAAAKVPGRDEVARLECNGIAYLTADEARRLAMALLDWAGS